jgi:hypothetical protein
MWRAFSRAGYAATNKIKPKKPKRKNKPTAKKMTTRKKSRPRC